MSRRRDAKQQEKEAFLQQNPTLIEYETHIEVAQDDEGRYALEITENDDDPYLIDLPSTGGWFPEGVSIPNVGTAQWAGFDGPVSSGSWTGLTLSEIGIGVASIKDVKNIIKGGPEEFQSVGTLSGNEVIKVEVEDIPLGPTGPFEPTALLGGGGLSFLDYGGTSIGINFDIIGGSGTVKVVLIDEDTGIETEMEFDTDGRGRRAEPVDHVQAVMDEGVTFEEVEISTTGDLEIAVVGIDLTTGYEYGSGISPA